jgi:hypothetical protein
MQDFTRRRRDVTLALALVITMGLASRTLGRELPRLISKDLGDALWSLMFYLIVVAIRPGTPKQIAALIAFALAAASEFFKLVHAPWLDDLRARPVSGFLLGRVFLWPNFIAYAAGVVAALALDCALLSRRRPAEV